MQYEKMPRFLLQTQSMVKQNMAPASGATTIRQQTEQLLEGMRADKEKSVVAHSFNQVLTTQVNSVVTQVNALPPTVGMTKN